MSNRKKVWFEDAGRRLDPALVEQLHLRRKKDPHETSNDNIPVIVYFSRNIEKDKKNELLQTCQKDKNNSLEKALGFGDTVCGNLTPQMIRQVKDHEAVDRIFYDRKVTTFLDIASKQIGAVNVQEQYNFTGKGVTVAVIDTGVFPHDDLINPTNRIVAFKDFINDQEQPYDDNGHGTHCAGDVAGNAYQSDGLYIGPAPEASIIGLKVLDQDGSGRLSTIIQGIAWCIEHKEEYNIRIISLSLGAQAYESYRDDPLSLAVQEAWHDGIVVCAAAGNSGPNPMTISTPAINPFIITVGSTVDQNTIARSDDQIANYSSRGPTIDSLIKPDIYTPGTDIISLLAPGSALEQQIPEQIIDENYIQLSGTSMATPICAGVIALMLEANPNLSPNDVKSILQTTSEPALDDLWGYVEAQSAVDMAESYSGKKQKVN
ncbi:serine protease [Virgibacillus profundi]|uniref:Serine protease n=1 Tax=Virgibacillus profundi TaxID=2024555 RepID=A0A2A2ICH1_9BACI|nr:S8 family peptidase [Virgibacillus profundi]PAV28845.1 serine protease [Virgibacillus profundi]PXY53013.1 serine protease [Virgibacillus profundi]